MDGRGVWMVESFRRTWYQLPGVSARWALYLGDQYPQSIQTVKRRTVSLCNRQGTLNPGKHVVEGTMYFGAPVSFINTV